MLKPIAIIPARGGSKRIPGKNIKNFLGKPIIAYSIEVCLKSNLFSEVIVSTDDEKIAKISKKFGASVPFMRSKAASSDFAPTSKVVLEVAANLRKIQKLPEHVCVVYPTAPFVTKKMLDETFQKLRKKNYSTVLPVSQYDFPIQLAMKIKNNKISYFKTRSEKTRSQDLQIFYHDTGMFYWLNLRDFEKQKKIIMKKCGWLEVDSSLVQDINTFSEWRHAELKYSLINGIQA